MKLNIFNDAWLALPRGQRRATVILLCIIVVLCGVRVVVGIYRDDADVTTDDFVVVEQEIEQFRKTLDTIPTDKKGKSLLRHKKVMYDTVFINTPSRRAPIKEKRKENQGYDILQPIPRIEAAETKQK